MPQTIKVKRGNRSVLPSTLSSGEFYLILDEGRLTIKSGETLLELANSPEVSALSSQLSNLVESVGQISDNLVTINQDISDLEGEVSTINTQLGTKLTTPQGVQGQVLGFTADNVVGAMDISIGGDGNTIVLSPSQPADQEVGGLWLKDLSET